MTGCRKEAIWLALPPSRPAHGSCSSAQTREWDEIQLSAGSTRGFALLTPANVAALTTHPTRPGRGCVSAAEIETGLGFVTAPPGNYVSWVGARQKCSLCNP